MRKKKQTVEYIASVEHLDKALTVVGIKGSLFLLFCVLLSICVIVWAVLGKIPIFIKGKGILFDTEHVYGKADPSTLKIYCFLPLMDAVSIQPGMKAKMAIDSIDVSAYGMIQGVVKEISPYPVSLSDPLLKEIPSESLKEYLIDSIPMKLITIDPILNSSTVSGFDWDKKSGPPKPIESGMTGTVDITLKNVRPISYVIPSR